MMFERLLKYSTMQANLKALQQMVGFAIRMAGLAG
jgi:hypothetical protein